MDLYIRQVGKSYRLVESICWNASKRVGLIADAMIRVIFTLSFSVVLSGTGLAAEKAPLLIGSFSNMKISTSDDPHFISGYDVNIYQSDGKMFGDIAIGIGAPEPAKAVMYDIQFDPTNRKLSFKAKYSDGLEFQKDLPPEGRESRVLLHFTGNMSAASLVGTVQLNDGYSPSKTGTRERVVMKKERDTYVPASYAEWRSYNSPANW
jgi:hypothetical protein